MGSEVHEGRVVRGSPRRESNINIFLVPKIHLLRKISKNWTYFTRISEFFRKIILNFSIFMIPYKSREILGEFYYLVEKFIKESSKNSLERKTFENCTKILEIFGENRRNFVEHCELIVIWGMISIGKVKISNMPAKSARLDQKWRKIRNFIEIFWSKSRWKIDIFSQLLTKYFLEFWLLSESIIALEEMTRFLQQFFRFRGGGRGSNSVQ